MSAPTKPTIESFRVSWTADHAQYYQGHSITFSNYTHSGQGCGETLREAFDDALECLCEQLPTTLTNPIVDKEFETEALDELISQVKSPAMLDWDIVQAECDEQGEHLVSCTLCDGHGTFTDDMDGHQEPCERCADTEHVGEQIDEDPDCSVCAGE